jgi:hypothetical protein
MKNLVLIKVPEKYQHLIMSDFIFYRKYAEAFRLQAGNFDLIHGN